ncbi:MAG: putative molybdenum carrier protein, partial [Pirellula sp.]
MNDHNGSKPNGDGRPTDQAGRKSGWIEKIVSGGQTGVDRAALDAAFSLGIEHGGWCPKGRMAEDGTIPLRYQLQELDSPQYSDRTKRNVLDSDGTLILHVSPPQGGTLLTLNFALQNSKPCLKVRLGRAVSTERIIQWIDRNKIRVLNIAGPRASKEPEAYQQAYEFLLSVFQD